MSGGDGIGHNSGAHNSGGSINGGPTGFGGGGGNNSNAAYSDRSGWSSENNGWSSGKWGPDGGNSGGSGGSKSYAGYAVAALSMTRPAVPAFVYPVNGVLRAVINMNTAFINNQLINLESYITKAKPLAARMATLGASRRHPVAGFALLATDFEARRKETALRLEKEAIARARREAKNVGINDIYQVVALPLATVFATSVAMNKIKAKISEKSMVVTDVVAQPVINVKTQQRQMAITKNWEGVPVVKAQKTDRNIYSAPVVAGMKPIQISINHAESFQKDQSKLNLESTVEIFSSAVISDTHHAIIDFDGEHDSIYISVSKTPTANEEIKQLVEAEKVEQEWLAAHPLLAAE
ncbi:colicin-like bacteriocin tRNase domain-containing protein, partial [Xenorhabdus bovienii]|uniref:colicin-like bacteriocin tRNase domain-containing protein n=1 Tax=Xenorhabdus bovienii TaxID=40576 RepID=UPI003DA69E10